MVHMLNIFVNIFSVSSLSKKLFGQIRDSKRKRNQILANRGWWDLKTCSLRRVWDDTQKHQVIIAWDETQIMLSCRGPKLTLFNSCLWNESQVITQLFYFLHKVFNCFIIKIKNNVHQCKFLVMFQC